MFQPHAKYSLLSASSLSTHSRQKMDVNTYESEMCPSEVILVEIRYVNYKKSQFISKLP